MSEAQTKGRLYQYAILLHPVSGDSTKRNPPSEIIAEPSTILAASDKEALIKASRAVPEEYLGRLDEVEIAVRPF